MNCPECKAGESFLVVEDKIFCNKCDEEVVIGYWVCTECGYSFRTNGYKFMDGALFDIEILDDLTSSLGEVYENVPMSDLLNPCVKCGSLKSYKSDKNEYTCIECGFVWEILCNE